MKTEDNNRMEALACIIADLKAENIIMTVRVQQLVNYYKDVLHQLNGKEKHEPNTEGRTLGELTEALDKCEVLEKDNKLLNQQCKLLSQQCVQLQTERDEAKTHVAESESQKNELFELIHRFENSDIKEIGEACPFKSYDQVKVGSGKCISCRHFLKMKKCLCVLCAYLYDNKKEHDAREMMATDE